MKNSKKSQKINNITNKAATKINIKLYYDTEFSRNFELTNSFLFKIYIKSTLINAKFPLKVLDKHDIQIFNKKIAFLIESAIDKEEQIKREEIFIVNEDSEINILSDEKDEKANQIEEEFEKISIEDNQKDLLKNLIEKKYQKIIQREEKLEIVGFEEELEKIYKLLSLTTQNNGTSNMNFKYFMYKSLLISGPSGVGKTYLLKNLESTYKNNLNFLHLDIYNELFFNSDIDQQIEYIKNIFKFAKLLSPAVIIIEEIDRFFSQKEDENNTNTIDYSDNKEKALYIFINEMDKIENADKIFLIATCTNTDKIKDDLKKLGRFDFNLSLNAPDQKKRKQLIKHFCNLFNAELIDEDYEIIADKSHGFVAGDLIQMIKNALFIGNLNRKTIEISLANIKPINLKEIILDVPKVPWTDIGGNKDVIRKIRNSIEWPLTRSEQLKKIGITSPSGILLYGPPGCSKTMIAKALATESGFNFFAVKGPELFSKYVGDTEKAVRDIFKKAKISSPSIIFFDEIDSMASQRGTDSAVNDKVLCQLLNEMDGIESREKVVIFGATNRPEILDKALIRPGRFDKLIYIPPPDYEARIEIFKINLSKMCVSNDVEIQVLAEKTHGFSGAEISELCKSAGMLALEENINAEYVKMSNFIEALAHVKPQITKEMINFYQKFADNLTNI